MLQELECWSKIVQFVLLFANAQRGIAALQKKTRRDEAVSIGLTNKYLIGS